MKFCVDALFERGVVFEDFNEFEEAAGRCFAKKVFDFAGVDVGGVGVDVEDVGEEMLYDGVGALDFLGGFATFGGE